MPGQFSVSNYFSASSVLIVIYSPVNYYTTKKIHNAFNHQVIDVTSAYGNWQNTSLQNADAYHIEHLVSNSA